MFVLFKSLYLDGLSDSQRDRLRTVLNEAGSLPGVTGSAVMDTFPGALNAGEMMWRATFADEQSYRDCLASSDWAARIAPVLDPATGIKIDSVAYAPKHAGYADPGLTNGVYRMHIHAIVDGVDGATLQAMEDDHLLMPGLTPVIRNWVWGDVVDAEGFRNWVHVWEQEYSSVEDFTGPYLMEPVHWGLVDRWYDIECPDCIAEQRTFNALAPIARSVMTPPCP